MMELFWLLQKGLEEDTDEVQESAFTIWLGLLRDLHPVSGVGLPHKVFPNCTVETWRLIWALCFWEDLRWVFWPKLGEEVCFLKPVEFSWGFMMLPQVSEVVFLVQNGTTDTHQTVLFHDLLTLFPKWYHSMIVCTSQVFRFVHLVPDWTESYVIWWKMK